jgi:hypothetical protein
MKKLILVLIALLVVICGFSQVASDTIEIQQKLGKVYLMDDKPMLARDLYSLLNTNEEAAVKVKQAKSNLFPLYLFSITGGFMIGWPIGTAIAGGDANWTLALIGVGLVGLSIPFQVGYNKNIYNAVRIYNTDLQTLGQNKPIIEFGITCNGLGMVVRF